MAKSFLGDVKDRLTSHKTIKIGVLASLVGPIHYYGTMQVRGVKLGIEYATAGTNQVAGHNIELIVEDDAGDPGYGGQKARSLIEDRGVHILQGCTSSAVTIVVAKIAQEFEKILIVEPAAADSITGEYFNPYIFRTAATTWQDAAAGGKYAVEHLGKTFGFIAPDYVWGQQSNSAWTQNVENNGGKSLIEILAPPNTLDFKPYLEEIVEHKPDVLVQSWAGAGNRELFSDMREIGVFDKIKVTGGLGDREGRHALGLDAIGLVGPIKYSCVLPENPINDWLCIRHNEEYAEDPDLFTGGGFAAGILIVEALRRTGGRTKAEEMIPTLEGMSFEAPKGTYQIRTEDHQALQPMYIVEMVRDPNPDNPWAIPKLIQEIDPVETAPPVQPPVE